MDSVPDAIRWRGAHHLTLVTRDLDATIRFYHGLLGMPLWAAMPPLAAHGRHCLLRVGGFFMHFFEDATAQIAAPPPGWEAQGLAFVPGALQHIAVSLADEADLLALRERLGAAGVPVTALMHEGPLRQFLFVDNNGIIIEANWAPEEAHQAMLQFDYSTSPLFNDPDPVDAVKELLQTGRLQR